MVSFKKKVYESKKARDILDEEFVEFGPIKRNINEFFNLYDTKFYDIAKRPTHKFFSEESFKYVKDYVNPKELQKLELIGQIEQTQISIDSIEKFHPIFSNTSVLRTESDNSGTKYYLIQSGKTRRIHSNMVQKVKDYFRQTGQPKKLWTIQVPTATIQGIPDGPDIETEEDLEIPIYTINTGKELPSNIYSR